jgi:hypothetical protein
MNQSTTKTGDDVKARGHFVMQSTAILDDIAEALADAIWADLQGDSD